MIKQIIFLLLWILKTTLGGAMYRAVKTETSKFMTVTQAKKKKFELKCKVIYWLRKLEFIFFNMVLSDALFIATRCMSVISWDDLKFFLANLDSLGDKIWILLRLMGTMIIFLALLADMLELFRISLNIS